MTHHTGPWAYPPRRKQRSAWRYMPLLIALMASIGIGHALAEKAIPQAALDAVNHGEMK